MSNQQLPPYVSLDISSISLALLVIGVYVCVIGQVSYWLKERLYISSALVSVAVGIAVGPLAANIVSPLHWVNGDVTARNELTYQIARTVIGIQVMWTGITLPAAYLRREWRSLAVLLVPIMTIAWVLCAGLILALIPGLSFLEALCISACITPTDPVLAASITQGRYAEQHVARNVRDIISAESGANDGLGYPFIFLPILLMRQGNAPLSHVMGEWVVSIWIYDIFLSCLLGGVIGFIARKTLKEAHRRQLVDHESFLSYGVGLAFLTLGVVGVIGSDDLLAAFIAGNSLTWHDFYRIESEDDTFQNVIDSLINASVFIYFGTLIPWTEYALGTNLAFWRMIVLAILILAFKRLPWIVAMYRIIPALQDRNQAIFTGWYGPVGVSAIYYAQVALRELPEDRTALRNAIVPIVYFIAFSSTLAHGISIPITKFGPKVLTRTRSTFSRTASRTGLVINRLRAKVVKKGDISAPVATSEIRLEPEVEVGKGSALPSDQTTSDIGSSRLASLSSVHVDSPPMMQSADSSNPHDSPAIVHPHASLPGRALGASAFPVSAVGNGIRELSRPSTPVPGQRVEFELPVVPARVE